MIHILAKFPDPYLMCFPLPEDYADAEETIPAGAHVYRRWLRSGFDSNGDYCVVVPLHVSGVINVAGVSRAFGPMITGGIANRRKTGVGGETPLPKVETISKAQYETYKEFGMLEYKDQIPRKDIIDVIEGVKNQVLDIKLSIEI